MRHAGPAAARFVLCCLPVLAGCTLVGLGLGTLSDRTHRQAPVPGWQVESVPKGRQVLITTRGGQVIGGRYEGVEEMTAGDYARRYAAHRARPDAQALPDLGAGAVVSGLTDQPSACDLVGFTSTSVVVRFPGRTDNSRLAFDTLRSVRDASGHVVEASALQQMVFAGGLPLLTSLSVHTSTGTVKLAMDEVVRVDVPSGSHGRKVGALVGAVIDTVVLVAVAVTFTDSSKPPPCQPGEPFCGPFSCPHVYSFDGAEYRLDSESFAGAIYPQAQRRDVDNLDYIRAKDDRYRIKVANELHETDYVDEMTLLVADHAPGTRVIPAADGALHVVGSARPPLWAHDLHGRDLLETLSARDGDMWTGSPIAPAVQADGGARDGIVVEFARPAGARSLNLVLRAQNTLWSSQILGEFLALHGSELEGWYHLLATSARERARLGRAMIREAGLRIAAWDGRSWRDRGHAWIVGPALPKEQVVVVDLAGLPGDRVRLRLDSTSGFWAVDSVAADFTKRGDARITEIPPAAARAHDGSDLTSILRHADGARFAMHDARHWAEVWFDAPPPAAGCVRSVLLRTAGYYVPHVRAVGRSQRERIAALLDEPDALGRYAVARARQQAAPALASGPRAR